VQRRATPSTRTSRSSLRSGNWLGEYIIGFYTSHNDPAHNFVGPDGVTYSYDRWTRCPTVAAHLPVDVQVYNHPTLPRHAEALQIKNFTTYGEIWYYNKANRTTSGRPTSARPGVDPSGCPPM